MTLEQLAKVGSLALRHLLRQNPEAPLADVQVSLAAAIHEVAPGTKLAVTEDLVEGRRCFRVELLRPLTPEIFYAWHGDRPVTVH